MKIYCSLDQSESDKRYILREVVQLGTLKKELRDEKSEFEIFSGSDDNAWGEVIQVGNYELEFSEYYIDKMIEMEIQPNTMKG